jgi:hypothetical protein
MRASGAPGWQRRTRNTREGGGGYSFADSISTGEVPTARLKRSSVGLVHGVVRLGRLNDTARSHQHGLPNTVRVHDAVAAIIVVIGAQVALPASGHDEHTPPPQALALLPVRADVRHMVSLPQAEGREPVVMTKKW